MPSKLPAHASPALRPMSGTARPSLTSSDIERSNIPKPLPPLLSPAFTQLSPAFGQLSGDDHDHNDHSQSHVWPPNPIPVDTSRRGTDSPRPELVETLPEVSCIVRARIPTTTGTEMFLHLYENNVDQKEHLAIVFGSTIRSRSLDAERPGETEQDRMIRGAYVGRLYPGRTSSRIPALAAAAGSEGRASPLLQAMYKRAGSSVKDVPVAQPLPAPARPLHAPSTAQHSDESDSESPLWSENHSPPDSPRPSTPLSTDLTTSSPPLVRIHSECYTGETVWSARCDCGEQLDEAARLMSLAAPPSSPLAQDGEPPGGVIVYLRQEGRGIGLSEKLKAYNLQDLGSDTYEANLLLRHPADARSYGLATAMLVDLGLGGERGIRLLTNNPDKVRAVEGPGREVVVVERVPMVPLAWQTGGKEGVKGKEVEGYLRAKIEQFGHMLSEPL